MKNNYSEFTNDIIKIRDKIIRKGRTIVVPNREIEELFTRIASKNSSFKQSVALEDFSHLIVELFNNKDNIPSVNDYIINYLKQNVSTFNFYFMLGKITGFINGYQLGSGKLYQLKHSDSKIQNNIKQLVDSYDENDWYMLLNIPSNGIHNATIIAVNEFKKNICVNKIATGSIKYTDSLTKFKSSNQYIVERNGVPIINLYSPASFELSTNADADKVIVKFNRIIEHNNTQIEESLNKILDILSIIDESTQLHIRFLLFTIALESLLLGKDDRDYLRKNLAEKITFLIGFKNALQFFSPEEIIDNNKSVDKVKVLLKFQTKITSFYDKRSKIAHAGINDDIDSKDVENISSILILIILKLFDLIEIEEISHIVKTGKNDETSLDFYLSKLRYTAI